MGPEQARANDVDRASPTARFPRVSVPGGGSALSPSNDKAEKALGPGMVYNQEEKRKAISDDLSDQ